MSTRDEISRAIGAHGMWKQRLRAAIASGKSELAPADVARDNLCDFGKWLHSDSTAGDRASPEYRQVLDLHAQFHRCASGVLSAALAGNHTVAENAMGLSGEFTSISADLTKAMMNWKAKAGG